MEQLFTVWGETLDKEHVLDEYPRPLMYTQATCTSGIK